MARIPYADTSRPGLQPLVEDIVAQRGSLLHLYQMLAHAPAMARGWLALFTAIRQQNSLPGSLRELVIVRIAQINGASYEADQHQPIARREGVSAAQIEALEQWEESDLFDARQRAVLALTEVMTRHVHVPDEVFAAVRAHCPDPQLVELVITIGGYNMVSRVLEALAIRSDDDTGN